MNQIFRILGGASLIALLTLLGACASVGAPDSNSQRPNAFVVPLVNPSFNSSDNVRFPGWLPVEHVGVPSYSFAVDTSNPHSSPTSARIRRHGPESWGLIQQIVKVPADWIGKTARLTGYLRSEGVVGVGGGLIVQARGASSSTIVHDHMDDRRVVGTQAWKRHQVSVVIPPDTHFIQVAAILQDDGTLWVDDLQLEIVSP